MPYELMADRELAEIWTAPIQDWYTKTLTATMV